jgi:NAD-dependent oxidoreductase involved in siderophore biosynthesis
VHSEDTTDAGTTGTEPILRVGVIGLGWAGQQHMKAYAAMDGVELVAIAGQEDHLRQELGDRYEIPENRRLVDFSDLLAIDALDAVSIAVPTFLHAPIAIAALEKGLHVLTEKPIAARRSSSTIGCVGTCRRSGNGSTPASWAPPTSPRPPGCVATGSRSSAAGSPMPRKPVAGR